MMGAAPVVLYLALTLAAQDSGAAPPPAPSPRLVAETVAHTRPAGPDRVRQRRLANVAARLGTGLTPRRSPDDREQPLIGPVSLLVGFGTVVIDVEVPN